MSELRSLVSDIIHLFRKSSGFNIVFCFSVLITGIMFLVDIIRAFFKVDTLIVAVGLFLSVIIVWLLVFCLCWLFFSLLKSAKQKKNDIEEQREFALDVLNSFNKEEIKIVRALIASGNQPITISYQNCYNTLIHNSYSLMVVSKLDLQRNGAMFFKVKIKDTYFNLIVKRYNTIGKISEFY